jgi:hypothetical protein
MAIATSKSVDSDANPGSDLHVGCKVAKAESGDIANEGC